MIYIDNFNIRWSDLNVYDIMPNRYRISENGVIFDTVKNTIIENRIYETNKGYPVCSLMNIFGDSKQYLVHRLVAASFIIWRNKDENVVNHKDLDKSNNNIYNLEYTTSKGNARHAIKNTARPLVDYEVKPKWLSESYQAGKLNGNNTVFTEPIVHKICELMEKNISYPEILEMLNLPVEKNYLDIITKIRSKKLWYSISKNYNIPPKEYRSEAISYTTDQIEHICQLISNGEPVANIAKILDIPYVTMKEKDKFMHFIRRIKTKQTFTDISSKYF